MGRPTSEMKQAWPGRGSGLPPLWGANPSTPESVTFGLVINNWHPGGGAGRAVEAIKAMNNDAR
jgi:hypothetical protein